MMDRQGPHDVSHYLDFDKRAGLIASVLEPSVPQNCRRRRQYLLYDTPLKTDDVLHEMLGGYHRLLDYNFGNFTRCIDMLLKSNRPVAGMDELRCLDGFGRIEGGSSI